MHLNSPTGLTLRWQAMIADWTAWHHAARAQGWLCAPRVAPLSALPTAWDMMDDSAAAWDTHPDLARALCVRLLAIAQPSNQPLLMAHTNVAAWARAGHPARFDSLRVLIWGLRIASIPAHWVWIGTTEDRAIVDHVLPDITMMMDADPVSTPYHQATLFPLALADAPTLPYPSDGPLCGILQSARAVALRRNTPALTIWYTRWLDLGERVHRLLRTRADSAMIALAEHIRQTLAVSGLCDSAAYECCLSAYEAHAH